jgi:tetratricopeptide (TPR) repeat protein
MRLATLLLICLFAACLQGQDRAAITEHERLLATVFLDDAIKTADYDTHLSNLIKLIEANPGHDVARVALRRCMDIEDELADPRPLYDMLARLQKQNFVACGEAADDFVAAYIHLARRCTADPAWHEVAINWRGITQALVVGPFADNAAPAHDDAFTPEVMLDFAATYRGAFGQIGWEPLRHYDPLGDRIDINSQQRWTGYGYYIATELVSPTQQDARIVFALNAPGKVWLNGEQVINHDTRIADQPNEWQVNATLKRGSNLLVLKLSTVAGPRIRLRDIAGQPMRNIVVRAPAKDRAPAAMAGAAIQNHTQPAHRFGVLAAEADALGMQRAAALLELAAAQTYGRLGMAVAAAVANEQAYQRMPQDTLMRLQYLRSLERSELHSTSARRQLIRRLTEDMLDADASLLPAVFEKAELLSGDERYREATELLMDALGTDADWRVHQQLARLYYNAGWRMEHEAALKAALKAAPDALPVLKDASRHYSIVSAFVREIAVDTHRLTLLPGDPDTHMSLVTTLSRTGDVTGAITHLRQLIAGDPTNEYLLQRMAEMLAADGKLNDALQVFDTLAARSPRPESEYIDAARLCMQHGREDAAIKYLERALAADSGMHYARRQLQRIRGESEDFWSAHAVTMDEVLRHDITREQFPQADSALVLDEMIQIVYADGSSISYVHTIRKILTQDGVDARGRDEFSGELVLARTIRADGTILEPITQPGGLIEFPGVEVGAYLDVAYIIRSDGGPMETLDGNSFFFMDQDLYEPFAISRWVLLTPPGMTLNAIHHNLHANDPGVEISVAEAGGHVVHTWDVRNPRLPEYEGLMPSPLEFIPRIEFVQQRDWRERARKASAEGLRKAMLTPLITQRALELTQDAEGDIAKARAIYDWVNANITTSGDSWNPHQTLTAMAGDRERLFASLCAAAGIQLGFAYADAAPHYKQAPRESTPRPHWAYPHRDDFATFLYVVHGPDDARVYVDMADRLRPFGALSSRMSAAPVVLWLSGRYELANLPGVALGSDRFENRAKITLRDDGSAALEGHIAIHGERSYRAKEDMRAMTYDAMCTDLEADLSQHYSGFEATECRFPSIGEVGEPLIREYTGEVGNLATRDGDRLTLALPGEKLGRFLSQLVATERRHFDIVLALDVVQHDEIRISPPAGYVFSTLPEDLIFPTAPLMYSMQFHIEEGDLVVTRKMVLGPGRFRPHEYNDLIEQIKAIRKVEDSTLTLTKLE